MDEKLAGAERNVEEVTMQIFGFVFLCVVTDICVLGPLRQSLP